MIGLKNIEAIIGFLILILVYVLSVTPAGCFRAWVAKKMGDDTAESLGFLTLNPIVHTDPVGLAILLLFANTVRVSFQGIGSGRKIPIYVGFGWGKYIPVNPFSIHGKNRWLKLAVALFSDSFVHFCLPIIALIILKLVLLGWTGVGDLTPGMLLALQFHRAFVYLNVWLLVVEGIINAVMFGALYFGRESLQASPHLFYVTMFAPFVIIFLFGGELSVLIAHAINFVGGLIL